jgi:hypothetical protein
MGYAFDANPLYARGRRYRLIKGVKWFFLVRSPFNLTLDK